MKYFTIFILILCIIPQFSCDCNSQVEKELNPSLVLWYDKPASSWTEALPVGNGRLGAMIYGGTEKETIQFNEETLWTGQPHDYAHEGAHEVLDELRQLLWDGKQKEAHELGNERFMSQPFGQLCYQPFGNVLLDFPDHDNVVNFNRQLDLEDALTTVSYEVDEVKYKREIFASKPDQAVVIRLEASEKGALNFTAGMDSPHNIYEVSVEGDEIVLKGKPNNYPEDRTRPGGGDYPESKLTFEARLKVTSVGGELVSEGKTIKIEGAKTATLYLVAATSFVNFQDISGNPTELCQKYLAELKGKSYKELKSKHTEDYQNLFGRVELDLGKSEISNRPTNERLISFKTDEDPSLV
ncbi:MAG: glycoside hydrolase family 95 protein, partial [Draconibacterium sp.]|nr:glycoside hydrolase family 95 protein [Draconibacterium sp.]